MSKISGEQREEQILKALSEESQIDSDCNRLIRFTLNPKYDFGNRRLHFEFVIEALDPTGYIASYGASLTHERDDGSKQDVRGAGTLEDTWQAKEFRGLVTSGSVESDGQTHTGIVAVGAFVMDNGVYKLCFKSDRFLYHT